MREKIVGACKDFVALTAAITAAVLVWNWWVKLPEWKRPALVAIAFVVTLGLLAWQTNANRRRKREAHELGLSLKAKDENLERLERGLGEEAARSQALAILVSGERWPPGRAIHFSVSVDVNRAAVTIRKEGDLLVAVVTFNVYAKNYGPFPIRISHLRFRYEVDGKGLSLAEQFDAPTGWAEMHPTVDQVFTVTKKFSVEPASFGSFAKIALTGQAIASSDAWRGDVPFTITGWVFGRMFDDRTPKAGE